MPYYFSGFRLNYLQISLFISVYQSAVGFMSLVDFENEASTFSMSSWENSDPTVQPVITYIYLCG